MNPFFKATLVVFALGFALRYFLAWRDRRVRVAYRYRPMALFVGVPGSGKSYRLVADAVRSLAQGRHIRTNFYLRPDRVFIALRVRYGLSVPEARSAVRRISYIRTFEDLVDAYDCDVFLDEVQDLLSAQDWNIFPAPVVTWFAQHRHRLCRIELAAHKFGALHNYIRDGLVANIYLAKPAGVSVRAWRLVTGAPGQVLQFIQIKDEEEETLKSPGLRRGAIRRWMNGQSMPLDPIIGNCYDTEGGVLPSPLAEIRRERGKDLGIELTPRRRVELRAVAVDGLPEVKPAEHWLSIEENVPAHTLLALSVAEFAVPGMVGETAKESPRNARASLVPTVAGAAPVA